MKNSEIKQKIKENGFTLWQIAEQAGVTEGTICRWLRSERDTRNQCKILKALDELRDAENKTIEKCIELTKDEFGDEVIRQPTDVYELNSRRFETEEIMENSEIRRKTMIDAAVKPPCMRGIKQALKELRAVDSETALTEHALRQLVKSGIIPSVRCGSKYLINLDTLFNYLYTEEA